MIVFSLTAVVIGREGAAFTLADINIADIRDLVAGETVIADNSSDDAEGPEFLLLAVDDDGRIIGVDPGEALLDECLRLHGC